MPKHAPHLGTLVLLTALSVLSLNMFLPALPDIRADFEASHGLISLSVSGYMICAAVLQLLLGPLSDVYGRRPVLLSALGVYVIASVIAFMAETVEIFLFARFLQALAISGSVLSSAIVRDVFDGDEAAAKMSTISAAMAIAPMLAPMLGGLVSDALGWRAVFLIYTVLGGLVLVLVWRDLGETRRVGKSRSLLAGLGLFRLPAFWAFTLCSSFSVGAFFIFVSGAPFVIAGTFGWSAGDIGFGIGSITVGFMVGAAISAVLVRRFGGLRIMIAGRCAAFLGIVFGLAVFSLGQGGALLLIGATVCVGFGNGMTVANAQTGALSLRPEQAGAASGFSGALLMVIGSFFTWGALWVLTDAPTPERLLMLMGSSVLLSLVAATAASRLNK